MYLGLLGSTDNCIDIKIKILINNSYATVKLFTKHNNFSNNSQPPKRDSPLKVSIY